jgi:hypothetical protein
MLSSISLFIRPVRWPVGRFWSFHARPAND